MPINVNPNTWMPSSASAASRSGGGGVLGGVSTGAALGSVVPGVGNVLGAGIGAAAGLGSSLIGKHGNNKALEAQTRASQEALAMEKENEAYRRSEARRIEDLQRAQFEAEQARLEPYRQAKRAFLRSQGIDIPQEAAPAFVPGQMPQGPEQARPRTSPFAAMMGPQEPQTANIDPVSLQEIMSWGSRFGARR